MCLINTTKNNIKEEPDGIVLLGIQGIIHNFSIKLEELKKKLQINLLFEIQITLWFCVRLL